MKCILHVAAVIAISAAAFAPVQASAGVNVNIIVPIAPPAIIVEAAPSPRIGFIWAPGFWNWNGHKHFWIEGHWEQVRDGHRYERPEWRRDGDKWRFQEGGWKKAKYEKKHKREHKQQRDDHDGHNGHFCPPGQAKKGNC